MPDWLDLAAICTAAALSLLAGEVFNGWLF